MSKITLAASLEPQEVELFGADYLLRGLTKKVSAQFAEQQGKLDELDDDDQDAGVELLAGLLDIVLEPVGDKKVRAKTLVLRKWNANELELQQIAGAVEQVQGALEDRGRPTSPAKSAG